MNKEQSVLMAYMEYQTFELLSSFKDWNISDNEKSKNIFLRLFKKLDEIWNTQTNIEIVFDDLIETSGNDKGEYDIETNTIKLYQASILVALHEWKHKLQVIYPFYTKIDNPEKDAEIWSQSIFLKLFSDSPSSVIKQVYDFEIDKIENRIAVKKLLKAQADFNKEISLRTQNATLDRLLKIVRNSKPSVKSVKKEQTVEDMQRIFTSSVNKIVREKIK